MAIKLMKVNNSFNIYTQHFYIDNISDLDTIDDEYKCQMGDIAELPDGAKYRRHSDDYFGNLWEYYTGGGSSGNLVVQITTVEGGVVADKTMREICTALQAGKTVNIVDMTEDVLDLENPVSEKFLFSAPANAVVYFENEGVGTYYISLPDLDAAPSWIYSLYAFNLDDYPTTVEPESPEYE